MVVTREAMDKLALRIRPSEDVRPEVYEDLPIWRLIRWSL